MLTARLVTVVSGVIVTVLAVVVARLEVQSLLDLFLEIMGLFGGSLAGLFILGMFTRRTNGIGALTGAVYSAAVLYDNDNGVLLLCCCCVRTSMNTMKSRPGPCVVWCRFRRSTAL